MQLFILEEEKLGKSTFLHCNALIYTFSPVVLLIHLHISLVRFTIPFVGKRDKKTKQEKIWRNESILFSFPPFSLQFWHLYFPSFWLLTVVVGEVAVGKGIVLPLSAFFRNGPPFRFYAIFSPLAVWITVLTFTLFLHGAHMEPFISNDVMMSYALCVAAQLLFTFH